jgi:23S rRNA (uracil1939-C5)-methyltransferase
VKSQGWQAYDEKKQAGLLRSLMIRQSHHSGEVMVNLVTSAPIPNPESLVEALQQSETVRPDTIVNSISTRKNRIAVDEAIVLSGSGVLEENFCGLTFTVSPGSFLQTHTSMAEQLYKEVLHQADIQAADRVLDLYCGIGTLTLMLAQKAAHVFGIESVQSAVNDAADNARRNGIENVEFRREILGREGVPDLPPHPDMIITDPPRDGMEEGVVAAIRRSKARRLVYVSCHPAHLARDAQRLCEDGIYQLKTVLPFDLFPQTAHIETLAIFDRGPCHL